MASDCLVSENINSGLLFEILARLVLNVLRQTLEQRNAIRKEQQDIITDEILEKGFRAWAQEKYWEKIEAEVRAQVLTSMGLSEDDFASLEAEVQKKIQDIIEEKIREKMTEEITEDLAESGNGLGAAFL